MKPRFLSKKRALLISAAIAAATLAALPLSACRTVTPPPGETNVIWTDKLDPEDGETVAVTSPAVKLPDKPASVPTADKTKPTAFGAVSVSDACYTLETGKDGEVFSVSYNSKSALPAYAYVYVPVTNYDGNAYLKIKANCESVERLAVLAVYYEQYEQSRPAVTVYNGSVIEGENTIICELGSGVILGSTYNAVLGEKLTQKTICGFMLMIDSNPKQVIDSYSGKFAVTEMSVTGEDDPDLSLLYAPPYISAWKAGEGYNSCEIATSRSDNGLLDAKIDYSVSSSLFPRVEAEIANYKSEYTTVKMDIKGTNVKTLTIALKYNLKTSSDNIDYNYLSAFKMSVGSDWETLEFDFANLEELKSFVGDVVVPGSYVKNLNPSAIYFFLDAGETNTATLEVRNVTFSKPETGGAPRVTSTWSLGAGGITKSNVADGGIGTLDYNKRQGWNAVTINVGSYDPEYSVLTVRVKFYSTYSNLGIALGYGSSNTVLLQSKGMTVPSGFGVKLVSHTQESGEDDAGAYTFHTFVIDFSDATTTASGSEKLCEQPITKILLYIDAAAQNSSGAWTEPSVGANINPARKMQFVGIEFKKPQA